jgi:hypothetical protein
MAAPNNSLNVNDMAGGFDFGGGGGLFDAIGAGGLASASPYGAAASAAMQVIGGVARAPDMPPDIFQGGDVFNTTRVPAGNVGDITIGGITRGAGSVPILGDVDLKDPASIAGAVVLLVVIGGVWLAIKRAS